MADDCIFCKIVRGAIPAEKVFANDVVIAFLDIHPIAPGHTLVVPVMHAETFVDLRPDVLMELALDTQKVARAVLRATGAPGFNLLMNNKALAGQAIPHAHFHVIPRKEGDGVRFGWAPKEPGDLAKLAADIRDAMK
jgi:histidine triad (HIT) family protein